MYWTVKEQIEALCWEAYPIWSCLMQQPFTRPHSRFPASCVGSYVPPKVNRKRSSNEWKLKFLALAGLTKTLVFIDTKWRSSCASWRRLRWCHFSNENGIVQWGSSPNIPDLDLCSSFTFASLPSFWRNVWDKFPQELPSSFPSPSCEMCCKKA